MVIFPDVERAREEAFTASSIFHDEDEAGNLDQSSIDWFLQQGVDVRDLVLPWPVFAARVVFDGPHYQPCPSVGDFAFIFAVIGTGIIDAAAWQPSTGRLATRLGIGAMLGEGQLSWPEVGRTGAALPVWRTPIAWLRAGRRGVVVLNMEQAAHSLAGLTIQSEDDFHARDLRRALRVPPPTLVSRRVAVREAAAA